MKILGLGLSRRICGGVLVKLRGMRGNQRRIRAY